MSSFEHEPVLAAEVVDLLAPVPGGLVIDGTVGGGGHAARILDSRPDLRVLGIDRDAEARAAATAHLARFGERARVAAGVSRTWRRWSPGAEARDKQWQCSWTWA